MIELLFSVRAKLEPGQRVQVVGSIPQLGSWNPQNSLVLNPRKQSWEGTLNNVNPDIRLEFKLIKIKTTGQIEWQQLPNNSNRKFKPKFSTQIHLDWNQPAGRVNSISKDSFKLEGLPAVMLNKGKEYKCIKGKVSEEFDPYAKARDEESEEQNEQQFLLVRRRMSQQITINSKDMEETYYKNSSVEILSALMKKVKIYVVSKDLDSPSPLHLKLEEELNRLPPNYLARWTTPQSLNKEQTPGFSKNIKRNGSLFQIGPEELYLQSLYSLTSYFLILDLEVVFSLNKILSQVSCCLYLPSEKYSAVIDNLSQLTNVELICFDSMETNKAFYEYLIKTKDLDLSHQEGQMQILSMETPSVQSLVSQLQKLKYRQSELVNTVQSLTISQLKQVLSRPNSICVIDYAVFEEKDVSPELINELKDRKTMMIIVCQEEPPLKFMQKMQDKSNVFVYNNFENIRLEGKQYYPLRSFREIIQQLKMNSKLYIEKYGGEVVERESSLLYFLPEGKINKATKIQLEVKKMVEKFAFIKVSRKGIRIKISWSLSKEARLLRTLSELKYVNMGELGDFQLIAKKMNFRQLREDIRILIELLPLLFQEGHETKVNDYEFGCYIFEKLELKKYKSEMS